MTHDEIHTRGYFLRWKKTGSRGFRARVFLRGVFIAELAGRSLRLVRDAAYEQAITDYVRRRLSR